MIYLLAIVLPPLALLLVGKPFQAILSAVLVFFVISWPVASIWAFAVVANSQADKRVDRLAQEFRRKS